MISLTKLQNMVNRLALAPVRTCRSLHSCVFCPDPIRDGQQYRDKGYGCRAHELCFKATAELRVLRRMRGEDLTLNDDGYNGLCADCADKQEALRQKARAARAPRV